MTDLSGRPRILFVAPWVPSVRRPRSLSMLRHLHALADVRCLVATWNDLDHRDAQALPGGCTGVPGNKWHGALRAGIGGLRGRSLQQAFADSPGFRKALRAEIDRFAPDLVFFNVIRSAQWMDETGALPAIVDLDEKRSAYYAQRTRTGSWVSRAVATVEAGRMARAEIEAIGRAAAVIVSSPVDSLLTEHPDRVVVLRSEPAISAARWSQQAAVTGRLLFVGRLGYEANIEALHWFCSAVMPMLRERGVPVTLRIVGAEVDARVLRLAAADVEVVGYVDDVGVEYARAQAVIVPVRAATGVQMKFIEALRVGAPTIATPICVELAGMAADEASLVADGPADWCEAIEMLMASPGAREQLSHRALNWSSAAYSTDARSVLERLVGAALTADRPAVAGRRPVTSGRGEEI